MMMEHRGIEDLENGRTANRYLSCCLGMDGINAWLTKSPKGKEAQCVFLLQDAESHED